MISAERYVSGRSALATLSTSIASLTCGRGRAASFADRARLAELLFLRGDLLGRIADHDRAELAASEAIALAPGTAGALFVRAWLAARFHRFEEAGVLLDCARAAGHAKQPIDAERAALLQATGLYGEALTLRKAMAHTAPGIRTLGALASLLADMGEWQAAESRFTAALDADAGVSPIPCAQLLFDWGMSAMRRGDLERADELLAALDTVLPQHVPGRGHRAAVALARGDLDTAEALIRSLLGVPDDPAYRAISAQVLCARGMRQASLVEAERAAAAYEALLSRRLEAYAGHAAAFFLGVGDRPQRAFELALIDRTLRDTPRSRGLLAKAVSTARLACA